MSTTKVKLEFHTISQRLQSLMLPTVDVVVGIARGGIVPASMVAHQLGVPLVLLHLNYRDDHHKPHRPQPQLLKPLNFDPTGKHILLVDDVSVTGATLQVAQAYLKGATLTTLTLKGRADWVLFPEIRECVDWPWSTP
ncbi:phosphoribosyltransferase [uncultured Meiothermus sp.]|jgi:hypoxanthine phosphoribosyltransferase|uniref:phosphoribosyltransferase n=1 Tax=uncultured Meiothermus sp. TaxID=157471 RepID=UPI0026050415|nr:phosphoribosyltransferase [uncultured Meiothermus sp.]